METTNCFFPFLLTSSDAPLPPWLNVQCLANLENRCPRTMEAVFERVHSYVTLLVSSNMVETFMVGITERPDLRWESSWGYGPKKHFDAMHLLFASVTSKKQNHEWSHTSTGLMETKLVESFSGDKNRIMSGVTGNRKMLNKEYSGGEHPSEGSPHFLYVVLQFTLE